MVLEAEEAEWVLETLLDVIPLLVPLDLALEDPVETLDVPDVDALLELDDDPVLTGELVSWLLEALELCDV